MKLAIEDHPQYPEWSEALADLHEANQNLQLAIKLKRSKSIQAGFAVTVKSALDRYNEISAKIDQ